MFKNALHALVTALNTALFDVVVTGGTTWTNVVVKTSVRISAPVIGVMYAAVEVGVTSSNVMFCYFKNE